MLAYVYVIRGLVEAVPQQLDASSITKRAITPAEDGAIDTSRANVYQYTNKRPYGRKVF